MTSIGEFQRKESESNLVRLGKTSKVIYSGYTSFSPTISEDLKICRWLVFFWNLNGKKVMYLTTKTANDLPLDTWKVSHNDHQEYETYIINFLVERFVEKGLQIKGFAKLKKSINGTVSELLVSDFCRAASETKSIHLIDAKLAKLEF